MPKKQIFNVFDYAQKRTKNQISNKPTLLNPKTLICFRIEFSALFSMPGKALIASMVSGITIA